MKKSSGSVDNHLRRGGVHVLILFLSVAAFIACLQQEATAAWTKRVIDGGINVRATSIKVDLNGRVHISIVKAGCLFYVHKKAGKWVKNAVDNSGDVGWNTSIAVDSSGKVHISYHDVTNSSLKYATNASGLWMTRTVDNSGDVGLFTSIALDKSGNVHISYYDVTNSSLKYATNVSGVWMTRTIDNSGDVGLFTSIALDKSGNVHISYYDQTNTALKYATNASGSWVKATVDNSGYVGYYTSIAVDNGGSVHISYWGGNSSVKYATNASGTWVTTTVDDSGYVGEYPSIAVDIGGKVHISYNEISSVSSSPAIESIVVRQVNNGVVSPHALKYTTNASGQWTKITVDDSSRYVGKYSSIAVDAGGKVRISYYDETITSLKYATGP